MTTLSKQILYYGLDKPLPEQIPLRAGPLHLFFENGDLRHIRYGDREVLRRVYVAVRDRNWGTVKPQLSNLRINTGEDHFNIAFEVCCQEAEIDFRWKGEIHGAEDGTITFFMDGESFSEFWRNRIGFCVLHPIKGLTGRSCEVLHTDGKLERSVFPEFIAPHQPFKNLRAISYEIAAGLNAEVRLEGDTFEMEDQRNWTDASFKTYCTPLELAFPVKVKVGDRVRQGIHIKLVGRKDHINRADQISPLTKISFFSTAASSLPSLGLAMASHGNPLCPKEIKRLGHLNIDHLRLDLHLSKNDWPETLTQAVDVANSLKTKLEVGLHLSVNPQGELLELRERLDRLKPEIARWLVYHESANFAGLEWVSLSQKILGPYDPTIPFGFGADSNFTELNRYLAAHPLSSPPSLPDFLVYAANPQVHAFDNLSLVENLAGLGETVRAAKRIANGRAVALSTLTLKPPFNAVATDLQRPLDSGELPDSVDLRQMSLFGAGWTLGSLKYLAENGVSSATFYETTGWRGVMETEPGSPQPEVFQSIPGGVFPLYHVFADLGEFVGGKVIQSRSSDPLKVESLVLRKGIGYRVLAANLAGDSVQILLSDLPSRVRVKVLDETNLLMAVRSPEVYRRQLGQQTETENSGLILELNPYALVRVDFEGDKK